MKTTLLILSIMTITSCGQLKEGEDRNNVAFSAKDLMTDSEATSTEITDQLEDAISSLSQTSDSSSSVSLMLAPENEITTSRDCKESDDGLTVSIEKSFEKSISGLNNLTILREASITRDWSHDTLDLECDSSGQYANVGELKGEGLSLHVEFSRTKSISGEKRGRPFSKSRQASGSRDIVYISSVKDSSYETNEMNLSFSVEKNVKMNLRNKDFSYSSKAQSSDLRVKIVRELESKSWVSKEIISGTVTAELSNGIKTVTTFNGVKFEKSDRSCYPFTGTLSGIITLEDESEHEDSEVKEISFSADFSTTDNSIVIDGEGETVVLDGCELAGL